MFFRKNFSRKTFSSIPNTPVALDTFQTVDKDDTEKEYEGSKVGNIGGGSKEKVCQGSSNFDEDGVDELQDLVENEKRRRRDTEEDGEVIENIDTIARDGDLSPRQINNLKNGV